MKALTLSRHGDVKNLKVSRVKRPVPGESEVLVHLEAAALNHLDLWVVGGLPGLHLDFPHICGADGAGKIESLGPGVTGLKRGEEVILNPGIGCGTCEACLSGEQSLCRDFHLLGEHRDGTFAEYVVVPAVNCHPKPSHLTMEEAAAFPLAFVTAYRMLFTRAHLQAGETLLIHGIGGGVSLAGLLLARKAGARIIVTSSDDEKLKRAAEMGADETINYRAERVASRVRTLTGGRGVDLVMDSVGEATWVESIKCVRKGGRIVTCGATTGPNPATEIRLIFWKQITIYGSTMGSFRDFAEMVSLVAQHRIRPVVDSLYTLDDGVKAYERMQAGKHFGKLVLSIY